MFIIPRSTPSLLRAGAGISSMIRSDSSIRNFIPSTFIKYYSTGKQHQSQKLDTKPSSTYKNSTTPVKPKQIKISELPDYVRKTIPGETEQSNSILSRIPTFPLRNRSSLIPRPGVPTASDTPLRSMLEILHGKKTPELIYEAEPHKLYFLTCGLLAFVFTVYGLTFVDWGFRVVWDIYQEDDDFLMFVGRLGLCSLITSIAIGVVTLALKLPTRLVRRIWYIPGPKEFIRFTSHPLLPGRATPVYTIPLENLTRHQRSKVFTKNGIYGTLDKSTFFFLLKENNKRFSYWIVDRNGWFWGDGRIFDILFGKESLEEAQKGQSYNDKLKEVSDDLQKKRKSLREEHGPLWQAKLGKDLFKNDLKKIVNIVSEGSSKSKKNDKHLPKN